MKLPSSQQPPVPQGQKTVSPAPPTETMTQGRDPVALSARQQLEQLQLANRETTLARVAEVISRQGAAGSDILLDVRGKSLLVQAAIGRTELETGDWVKVLRAGNELQLMGKLAPAPEAGIARALAQRMPWQQDLQGGLTRLLTSLTQGLKPDALPGQPPSERTARPMPEAARQALQQVLSRLPPGTTIQPGTGAQDQTLQQMKQWISESGLFAESRLAQTPSASLPDLKLAIGRVITALLAQQGEGPEGFNRLTPLASPELVQAPLQFPQAMALTPPASADGEPTTVGQMLRLLAGMLNRITVNQLHSQVLTARAGGEAPAPVSTLLLELPWLTPQNEPRIAQVRIEQHSEEQRGQSSQHKAASEWRLALAMDLDEAGLMHFDVSLRHQSVSARVWAEKQTTLRQIHEELPLLRQSLTDLGLEVTDLECRRGSPEHPATRLEHRLVDTRV
ncbi:flagellar hook-length control protein FliK [Marinobacter salinus]|uniref:Flagellar hook-length control protein FliK n=2 Tax=Marinobacter salinus TaxID=1874317 RepID=A0A1D9GI71_9GAMM|nr:flagellar hook-length control protein FliK [Marinobacter salinus]